MRGPPNTPGPSSRQRTKLELYHRRKERQGANDQQMEKERVRVSSFGTRYADAAEALEEELRGMLRDLERYV
jgi:hypothetical protein